MRGPRVRVPPPALLAPGLPQHANPVAVGDLGQRLVVVPALAESIEERRKSRDVAELGRRRGALVVGAETDAVDPHAVDEVLDVADNGVERGRVRLEHPVLAQETDREVDAYE